MRKVEDIIQSLSDKEAKNFIFFVNRMRTNQKESKIVQLFEAYYSRSHKNNDHLIRDLFPGMSKNAFYRLRNRLLDEVQQSLLVQYGRMDDHLQIHRTIMLARIAYNKDDYSTSHTLLLEAEKKALKIEAYELAMIVYSELINMSAVFGTIDSHDYIQKRKAIRNKHEKLSELRYIVSQVTFRLTSSIHNGTAESDILQTMAEIKDQFSESDLVKTTFNARLDIFQAIQNILYQEKKFDLLLEHLIKGYEEFEQEQAFTKAHHRTKIVILSWIIANHHWLLKVPASIPYLKEMHRVLEQHDGVNKDKFWPFYITYEYSTFFHTNQLDKGLRVLDQFTEEYLGGRDVSFLSELPPNVLVGHLGRLAQIHFALKQYDEALKELSPCYVAEIHEKLSKEFRMEVAILETIIYFEKKDHRYALDLLRRTKRVYKKLLSEPNNIIFKSFINILINILKKGVFDPPASEQKEIDKFLKMHPPYGEPFEKCINYKVWLEAKMNDKNYYDIVMDYANEGNKRKASIAI